MAEGSDQSTNVTLLMRLGQTPANEAAWNEFVERYGRMIFQWCRQRGVQEADAEDITQNVLLVLTGQMQEFVYDPAKSFRGWLRTIAYRSWCRFTEDRRRWVSTPLAVVIDRLSSVEARDDFLGRLEAESELELLEKAKELVRLRVAPRTWEAFRLSVEEELSGARVAELLKINEGTVFVAKSRIQKMIQQEARRLDGDPAE